MDYMVVYFFKVVIAIKDTNYNEIIKNIVSSLKDNFKILIERANFDRTFKAKIIGKISDNRYQILYRGHKYSVTSEAEVYTDQIVRVCAPQNNWSELFVVSSKNSSGEENIPTGVTGVKGENEQAYRTGDVNITKDNLGLGNVENKNSETIRNEMTSSNITKALGYDPANSNHVHDDRYYTESEINNQLNQYKKRIDGNVSGGFNSMLTQGQYTSFDNSGVNAGNPYEGYCWGILFVFVNDGGTYNHQDNWIFQMFIDSGGAIYFRRKINADPWSNWATIMHS